MDRGIDGSARKSIGRSNSVFGRRLREWRIKSGMTQGELAEAIGERAYTIVKYENGTRSPRIPEFLDIANALRVSPNSLLGWTPPSPAARKEM